ncbi:MAG: hypothetical protein Q9227_007905 [Pyrenula ochraceoflavens]
MEVLEPNQHPHPHPHPHHRKIDIQSPADLHYLYSNLSSAATAKLDLHFPPQHSHSPLVISLDNNANKPQPSNSAQKTPASEHQTGKAEPKEEGEEEEEDPLRAAVRAQLSSFINQTFTSALHGISVNGLDATSLPTATLLPASLTSPNSKQKQEGSEEGGEEEEAVVEYEPFDAKLSAKLASLYGELEGLTGKVAGLRREAVKRAAGRDGEELGRVVEEEGRDVGQAGEEGEEGEREGQVLKIVGVERGWNEEVGGMYERGLEGLGRLAGLTGNNGDGRSSEERERERGGSLTETVGRVQRAGNVVREIE